MVDETERTADRRARLLLVVQATRAVHIFESVIALCRTPRCGSEARRWRRRA